MQLLDVVASFKIWNNKNFDKLLHLVGVFTVRILSNVNLLAPEFYI